MCSRRKLRCDRLVVSLVHQWMKKGCTLYLHRRWCCIKISMYQKLVQIGGRHLTDQTILRPGKSIVMWLWWQRHVSFSVHFHAPATLYTLNSLPNIYVYICEMTKAEGSLKIMSRTQATCRCAVMQTLKISKWITIITLYSVFSFPWCVLLISRGC